MEQELEVKILNMDVAELKKKVIDLGAEKISKEHQINLRINSKEHPIDEELGYLRIRITNREGEETDRELTFKAKKKGNIVRNNEEYTVKIDDEEMMLAILDVLGYGEVNPGEKDRESYQLGDVRFDFDQWDDATYPHPYLEIEGKTEGDVAEIIQKLEIPEENVSTKSISDLIREL